MAKTKSANKLDYKCTECGWQSIQWVGRCGECQTWGTVAEVGAPQMASLQAGTVTASAEPITNIDIRQSASVPTGMGEFDRVLGGGLVPGAVVLLSGEPGVGKSTLLLEVASRCAEQGTVLYLTGEESASQVRMRANRVDALHEDLLLAAETDLGAVLAHVEENNPKLLIIDSVQTVSATSVDGAPGGMAQIREVAGALIRTAKARNLTTILVGHVTKDGSLAGPRTLEHLVDVVVAIEGERHARLRLVRATKNRFGPADEVGCFELGDAGIQELPDPSELFLTRRESPVAGSALTVSMEGTRPFVTEVQALVDPTTAGTARRAVSGLDSSRVAMVLAVLERHGQVGIKSNDTYTATVGGVKIGEPAADLAIALAVASSQSGLAIPSGVVAVGELGLSGEIRRVSGLPRRLAEAYRLGFDHALVPQDPGQVPKGMKITEVASISDALRILVGSTQSQS